MFLAWPSGGDEFLQLLLILVRLYILSLLKENFTGCGILGWQIFLSGL